VVAEVVDVLETPLMDYIVVGKTMTSLKRKGLIRRPTHALS
jgi:hypothetical protein